MPRREVAITGVGVCSAMADDWLDLHAGLCAGRSAISLLRTRWTSAQAAARVSRDLDEGLLRHQLTLADRTSKLAVRAAADALAHAGLVPRSGDVAAMGVVVGCGSGPTEALDTAYASLFDTGRMHPMSVLRCLPAGPAAVLSMHLGLHGPSYSHASACSASAGAIGLAMRAIRHGDADRVLVGGTESPFGSVTLRGWEGLRVLAPPGDGVSTARCCRPFDAARNGIVLGEGAAFFVLESLAAARRRGARVLALLAGYGASSDGHHWTEPSPAGQAQAMRAALHDAALEPPQIGYLNAHGTGTRVGDAVEAASIAEVFGTGRQAPWVSSTKGAHGHLLGASGALELAVCVAALCRREAPPTQGLETPDSELAPRLLRGAPAPIPPRRAVMSNSFAFGGSNACLVLAAA